MGSKWGGVRETGSSTSSTIGVIPAIHKMGSPTVSFATTDPIRLIPGVEFLWLYDAEKAGITKRVYPHLFRHQLITYLTKQGIVSPKLQLLSGHSAEKNLAIYRDLALSDVADEYEEAMKAFPIR